MPASAGSGLSRRQSRRPSEVGAVRNNRAEMLLTGKPDDTGILDGPEALWKSGGASLRHKPVEQMS
jgi:hypothetical protein